MEVEVKAEAKSRTLTNLAALTVVLLSVFIAVAKIKDDNIVQAMQQAKTDEVDTWLEYDTMRTRVSLAEMKISLFKVQEAGGATNDALKAEMATAEADQKRLSARAEELLKKAREFKPMIEKLSFRDDQFDMADAFLSVAIAVSAVAVLVEVWPVMIFGWFCGAAGIVMVFAGFLGWSIHPEWLVSLLT
ncbi:DUF4337 family protein [Terrarubrum flagellatum]|uniref:DUF4337 family protein n=1 Tax=Terrirubrum flagellatum TaxID=2895980 RepID=UPI0031453C5A